MPDEAQVDRRWNLLGGYRQDRRPFRLSAKLAGPYRMAYPRKIVDMKRRGYWSRLKVCWMLVGPKPVNEAKGPCRLDNYI